MISPAEQKVQDLKDRLKDAEENLKRERQAEAAKERERQRMLLAEKVEKFRNENATVAIGPHSDWLDLHINSVGMDITIYEYTASQNSIFLNPEDAMKLRDALIEAYPLS